MPLRRWIALGVLSMLALAAIGLAQANPHPPKPPAKSGTQANPLDAKTIQEALRTTAVEDQGFIERVVWMTNKGKLPPDLVDTTFDWARKKTHHKFQYFKSGLTARASQLGIDLSPPAPPKSAKEKAKSSINAVLDLGAIWKKRSTN